jgi:hypothetical protein
MFGNDFRGDLEQSTPMLINGHDPEVSCDNAYFDRSQQRHEPTPSQCPE